MKIGLIGTGKLGNKVIEEVKIRNLELVTFDKTAKNFDNCDVIIDCTTAGFNERVNNIHKPIIVATTQEIDAYPQNVPVLIIPNSSSWVLLHSFLVTLAKYQKYHFVINDFHSENKKDAPAGSARKLIAALEAENATTQTLCIRKFDIKGEYSITAFNEYETIKIEHKIHDRAVYAHGLVEAALWLVKQKSGIYTSQDFFKEFTKN